MKVHCLIENSAVRPDLTAEHGLSLLIETSGHRILFDAGTSYAFAENADRMGLDLRSVDAAVLSHGHNDHGGGMLRFLEINSRSIVWASPHAAEPHFNASGKNIGLGPKLTSHDRFRAFQADVLELSPGITLHAASSVPQPYPAPDSRMSTEQGGIRLPDDFRHEIYLLIEENNKKVLFSGCSHRGIINIINHFQPDVFVGGFHLMRTPMQELPPIADALRHFHARYFTGHCTGEPAFRFLKAQLGEQLSSFSSGCVLDFCL